jgi:acyl carrier protein
MNVIEKLSEMIIAELGVSADKITLEARLVEDLGADSIDAVQLIMDVETTFDVVISDDALATLKTVGDLVNLIEGSK